MKNKFAGAVLALRGRSPLGLLSRSVQRSLIASFTVAAILAACEDGEQKRTAAPKLAGMDEPVMAGGLEFTVKALECGRQYPSKTYADLDPRLKGTDKGKEPLTDVLPAKGQWCLLRTKVTDKRATPLPLPSQVPLPSEGAARHHLIDEGGGKHPVSKEATPFAGFPVSLYILSGITDFLPAGPESKIRIDSTEVILAFDLPKGVKPAEAVLYDLASPFAPGARIKVKETGADSVFTESFEKAQEPYKQVSKAAGKTARDTARETAPASAPKP